MTELHHRAYRVLKWWVRHEGECLADHPDIVAETRAIVAGIEAANLARIKELEEFLKRHAK